MILELAGGRMELPVLPEELEISSAGGNESAEVLAGGEVVRLRPRKLREVSIESLFPRVAAPYVTGTLRTPMAYVRAIQAQRDLRRPARLLLIGFDLDINMEAAIEDFTYREQGGEVGDIYYTLKLREYRAAATAAGNLSADGETVTLEEAPRAGEPETGKTYTVVKGDSLWAIAKRSYGDGSRYGEIYEKNRATIDGGNKGKRVNKYTIYPGQVFMV